MGKIPLVMNLPAYTYPIFYSAILLLVFLAMFPTSTTLFVMMLLIPVLVLYQAYIILQDVPTEKEENV